jgi:hypothetical protein
MPLEINEDELMNDAEIVSLEAEQVTKIGNAVQVQSSDAASESEPSNAVGLQYQHLGFVQLVEPTADPIFIGLYPLGFKQHPEAVRQWAKHFNFGPPHKSITVPLPWACYWLSSSA